MKFIKETVFAASVEEVFAFHERADAFALLQPPWEKAEIIEPPTSLEIGTRVVVKSRVGPVTTTIVAEHVDYEKNVRFADIMTEGPFKSWHHQHLFFAHEDGCRLRDEIDYEPPLGPLGRLFAPLVIERRLKRMFDYRHEVTKKHVEG